MRPPRLQVWTRSKLKLIVWGRTHISGANITGNSIVSSTQSRNSFTRTFVFFASQHCRVESNEKRNNGRETERQSTFSLACIIPQFNRSNCPNATNWCFFFRLFCVCEVCMFVCTWSVRWRRLFQRCASQMRVAKHHSDHSGMSIFRTIAIAHSNRDTAHGNASASH